jgi:hypothetical protein
MLVRPPSKVPADPANHHFDLGNCAHRSIAIDDVPTNAVSERETVGVVSIIDTLAQRP